MSRLSSAAPPNLTQEAIFRWPQVSQGQIVARIRKGISVERLGIYLVRSG